MDTISNGNVLIREREGKGSYREGHMRTKVEISCIQPQAKEHLKPPKVGRIKKRFFLRAFRKSVAQP